MSGRWTTGSVAGVHRAIMREGEVHAIANDSTTAAQMVRALNGVRAQEQRQVRITLMSADPEAEDFAIYLEPGLDIYQAPHGQGVKVEWA